MLKMMRTNAKYFYILFVVVILSFIFWGIGPKSGTEDRDIVAEVGPYKITAQEYYRTYDNMFKFYREIYKDKFDEDMQKKLNLKENVMNAMVDNRLLLVAAADNGIKVSDEELERAIESEPAFMKDGVFNAAVYQNRLRLERITPEMYEASKKQELAMQKMRRLIELSVNVPAEVLAKINADQKNAQAQQAALMAAARNNAVRSYLDGLRKEVKIKVYEDRIG
jgi:parvulin-like peptidyl-prolyl isomerase